ncbi:5-amino-6-(D-ribitylamino)uracil--L-tyrosine 4-hydroxyphenyl transferase CofH [Methanotorris igneus]|uniref:5-amino-6-(D-ribitylamino)uracil--L-tyrosine 4-hydroxyphenyl transferase n=1 Tax=Methanotorris igneus (strain DSM 5666 / JCM 11834 / Kol 5) TaxID=880724 RepID=F6BEN4_METIK|nr:5-amino-6-(D-ribitylamino)uracil--L-tyrosine 4-hydroxyphenyl transferase CofH [Methanotorris igneus]AEF96831.1 FO synthase subunit 2 [Methanotorris igneus Kol 5]
MDLEKFREKEISKRECLELFENDELFFDVLRFADELRRETVGDIVTYVVNRNINFTNICIGDCKFCAFRVNENDKNAYFLDIDEIARRALEAKKIGATEVCIQGGLHPKVDTYFQIEILKKVHEITKPYGDIHIHAFSPMEVYFAAENAGLDVKEALKMLKENGLNSMPGTAAEILDDEVRRELCPHKISTKQWVDIIKTAHKLGIPTTSTMMYGHIDEYKHWVKHLFLLKEIQKETNGFTEFVPLSFMHKYAPIYKEGRAKAGATGIEDLKVYAVSRIVLNDYIKNIQVSWVKLGQKMAQIALKCGGNDVGGTLMEENISRAAGAEYGVSMSVEEIRNMIERIGRIPKERTTLYKILE